MMNVESGDYVDPSSFSSGPMMSIAAEWQADIAPPSTNRQLSDSLYAAFEDPQAQSPQPQTQSQPQSQTQSEQQSQSQSQSEWQSYQRQNNSQNAPSSYTYQHHKQQQQHQQHQQQHPRPDQARSSSSQSHSQAARPAPNNPLAFPDLSRGVSSLLPSLPSGSELISNFDSLDSPTIYDQATIDAFGSGLTIPDLSANRGLSGIVYGAIGSTVMPVPSQIEDSLVDEYANQPFDHQTFNESFAPNAIRFTQASLDLPNVQSQQQHQQQQPSSQSSLSHQMIRPSTAGMPSPVLIPGQDDAPSRKRQRGFVKEDPELMPSTVPTIVIQTNVFGTYTTPSPPPAFPARFGGSSISSVSSSSVSSPVPQTPSSTSSGFETNSSGNFSPQSTASATPTSQQSFGSAVFGGGQNGASENESGNSGTNAQQQGKKGSTLGSIPSSGSNPRHARRNKNIPATNSGDSDDEDIPGFVSTGDKDMDKKVKHQLTDRQRRAKIKESMDQLKALVPLEPNQKPDQATIVASSVTLLGNLKDEVSQLRERIRQMELSAQNQPSKPTVVDPATGQIRYDPSRVSMYNSMMAALNGAGVAMWRVGLDGRMIDMNMVFEMITGFTSSQVLGRSPCSGPLHGNLSIMPPPFLKHFSTVSALVSPAQPPEAGQSSSPLFSNATIASLPIVPQSELQSFFPYKIKNSLIECRLSEQPNPNGTALMGMGSAVPQLHGQYLLAHLASLPANHVLKLLSRLSTSYGDTLESILTMCLVRDATGQPDHVLCLSTPDSRRLVKPHHFLKMPSSLPTASASTSSAGPTSTTKIELPPTPLDVAEGF